MATLSEARSKLIRAKEHLDALDTEIDSFLRQEPYEVAHEYDSEKCKHFFRLKIFKQMPQVHWATIIGDCVHNARSALDYIAWRLAGSDLADRQTMFPIYDIHANFHSAKHRFKRINKDAFTEITKLQPYKRRKPRASPLWMLQELDAQDKHKLFTTIATVVQLGNIMIRSRNGEGVPEIINDNSPIETFKPPFEHNAVVAVIEMPSNTLNQKVIVDGKFTFDIFFEEGILDPTANYSVRKSLRYLLRTVDHTIKRFESSLDRNPDWIIPAS